MGYRACIAEVGGKNAPLGEMIRELAGLSRASNTRWRFASSSVALQRYR